MADRERRIQEIAYLLWEGEGRPDGQAERFWHMAEGAYEAEAEMIGGDAYETAATEAGSVLTDVSTFEIQISSGLAAPGAPAPKKPAAKKTAAPDEGKSEAKLKAKAAKAAAPAVAKVAEPAAKAPETKAPEAKPSVKAKTKK